MNEANVLLLLEYSQTDGQLCARCTHLLQAEVNASNSSEQRNYLHVGRSTLVFELSISLACKNTSCFQHVGQQRSFVPSKYMYLNKEQLLLKAAICLQWEDGKACWSNCLTCTLVTHTIRLAYFCALTQPYLRQPKEPTVQRQHGAGTPARVKPRSHVRTCTDHAMYAY
jgi:hypothetical protein